MNNDISLENKNIHTQHPRQTQSISLLEKVSYGFGDTSANIFMGMTMMFLTVYYTDVFKLDPATMGTLFLITRFIDAISDPLIGSISDKTKSKLGRYRPWLKVFAIPYGLTCAAVFFTPDLSETARTIYAYITYIALVLSFSLVVVPYVSLLGAISGDSDERLSINTIRFPLAKTSYIICSLVVPSLIAMFDNEVIGYRIVMAGIGALCTILIFICYSNTTERVKPKVSDLTLGTQVRELFKNDQALILFGAQVLIMIMNTMKFGAIAYFVKYGMHQEQSLVTSMLTAGSIMGIVAPFISRYLLSKGMIGRLGMFFWSQVISGVLLLVSAFVSSDSVVMQFALFVSSTLFAELVSILIWAQVADCADYGEKKAGVRIDGMIGGGLLFSTKLGMAIGGAIMGYVLAYYQYDPETAIHSTGAQIQAYTMLYAIIPGLATIVAGFLFKLYKLDGKQ
ncbi:MFS transporter [Vibrio mediterranei]